MHEWLVIISENAVIVINLMALLMIAFGTGEAFIASVRAMFTSSGTGRELRDGYTRFARWLIVGLTFQLAADIIETATAVGWESVARLAAIAVVRTFLSYFLERDTKEIQEGAFGSEKDAAQK